MMMTGQDGRNLGNGENGLKHIAQLFKKWAPFQGSFLFFLFLMVSASLRDLFGIEARNALFARVMLENGPSLVPEIMGRPYPDYPPLFFWTEWLFSVPAGHVSTVTAVLPSAMAGALLVCSVFFVARRSGRKVAIMSSVIMALCPDFWIRAGRVSIDMMLALWVTLALWAFFESYSKGENGRQGYISAMAFSAVFMAFMTKGPIGIVLSCGIWFCFLVMEGEWKSAAAFFARSVLFAMLCMGIGMLMCWKAGDMELLSSMFHMQVTGRLQGVSNKPFYYYTLHLAGATAPWWLASVAGCLFMGRGNGKGGVVPGVVRKSALLRLVMVWMVFVFVVFNIASARAGRYLLPMFPAMAIFFAVTSEKLFTEKGRFFSSVLFSRMFFFLWGLLWGVGIFIYVCNPFGHMPGFYVILAWFLMSIVMVYAVTRLAHCEYAAFLMVASLMIGGLTLDNLLVEPGRSLMESGRLFAEHVENGIGQDVPVLFFQVNRDGDAVKYIFYSKRKSSEFIFVDNFAELEKTDMPFVMISVKKKFANRRLADFIRMNNACPAGEGYIHSRVYQAWGIGTECAVTQGDTL